ncbi:methyltransferase domain-containing protein [bacterium]|nr:methyltransferase domain-containing protein [bacterium]MCB9475378.1 methyltransferase domain-containing protein [Deltaproteobacteria bacterium]
MDVKSQAYVAEAVKKYDFQEPVLEVAAGWEPNYYQPYFKGKKYIKQDLRDWDPPCIDIVCNAKDMSEQVADGSVNTVLCLNTLEHVDEPHKVVDEIYRVLAVGGHVIVTVPTRCPIHRAPKDYWRFMPDGIFFLFRHFQVLDMMVGRSLTYPSCIDIVARKPEADWRPPEDFPYDVIRMKRENGPLINAIDAFLERWNLQFIKIR